MRRVAPIEVAKRLLADAGEHGLGTQAASLAYYLLLSVFPFLICLVAMISLFPLEGQVSQLQSMMAEVMPAEVGEIVGQHLGQLLSTPRQDLLGIGLAGALWAASRAVSGLIGGLNAAYAVRDRRNWLRLKVLSLALTVGAGGMVVVALLTLALGGIAAGIAVRYGVMGGWAAAAITVARWPTMLAFLLFAVQCFFFFGPNLRLPWRWVSPGSLLAVALWIAGTWGFRLYIERFGDLNATYGSLGAVVVLLLYFYVSAYAILLGGELNAVLDRRRGEAATPSTPPR
ncbi:YihY/virulence factor BrkB family protein [Myxococcota bacterium]|nr:YihY/virulence factor BrkB family protein [Myxococcota bacterium]